eukprot:TRINITY_DN9194_c0_g1_i4.p1 TRINITY_DN9194_c0_g1~~TRINITY_DN9194_c0_g1_i4.p1  ORF type:complete len:1010 (-),score=136.87 TRINITY_DN9194_c0_g1_i4:60-3089(-)
MASADRPPSLADRGVFYVLCVNAVVGIFALLTFSAIRYYNQNYRKTVPDEPIIEPKKKRKKFIEDEAGELTSLLPGKGTITAPPNEKQGEPFMGWFLPLLIMPAEEHLKRIGYDAMLYFYFQRSVMVFLFLIGLVSLVVLLPVNLSGNRQMAGNFMATTITNLSDPRMYWFHAFATVLYSLMLYGWVWHMRKYLLKCYGHYFTEYAHREVKSAVSSHSIWIKNFPRNHLNVQAIREHFETLLKFQYSLRRLVSKSKAEKHVETNIAIDEGGWLEHEAGGGSKMDTLGGLKPVATAHQPTDYSNDGEMRQIKQPAYEREHSAGDLYIRPKDEAIQSFDNTGQRPSTDIEEGDMPSTPSRLTGSRILALSRRPRRTMWGYGSMTQLTGETKAEPPKKEEEASFINTETAVESVAPPVMEWVDIDLKRSEEEEEKLKRKRRLRRKLLYKEISGGVVSVNIASDIARLIAANEQYVDTCGKLEHYKKERNTQGYRPKIEFPPDSSLLDKFVRLVTKAEMVDAIVEYKRLKKAKYMQLQRVRRDTHSSKGAGVVFVTFTSNALAKEVVNVYQTYGRIWKRFNSERLTSYSSTLKDHQWIVKQAPEPEDIIWKNLAITRTDKWLRIVIVNLILLTFFAFFTTPLGIVSTLQSAITINTEIGTILGAGGGLLFTYLPSLVLLFFTFLLPLIIWLSSIFEGHHTISSTHKWLVVKTYLYFLFNILILPSLFLTSIDALIEKALGNIDELWKVLDIEGFLPFSSGFLICYLLQMAVLGCSVEILRIIERVQVMWLKSKAVTKAEKRKADKFAFPHEYGMEYAYMVIIFSTTFAFSALVPLFVPAGLLYFFCKYITDSYHLVHVRPIDFHSDGSMLWMVLQVVLGTSALCQLGIAMVFFLHGSMGQFLLVASLPFALFLVVIYFHSTSQSFFKYPKRPKELVIADESGTWIQDFRLAYVHDLLSEDEEHMQLLRLQALENEAIQKKKEALEAKRKQEERLTSPRSQVVYSSSSSSASSS